MRLERAAVGLTAAVIALCSADARADAPAAPCSTDEVAGPALDGARWSVLRPSGVAVAVAGGRLRLPLAPGELAGADATARDVVLQAAPAGGWTATTRLSTGAVDAPGERAGLVAWGEAGAGANAVATATFPRAAPPMPRRSCRPTPSCSCASGRTAASCVRRSRWTTA